jgi:hypothetical protein
MSAIVLFLRANETKKRIVAGAADAATGKASRLDVPRLHIWKLRGIDTLAVYNDSDGAATLVEPRTMARSAVAQIGGVGGASQQKQDGEGSHNFLLYIQAA